MGQDRLTALEAPQVLGQLERRRVALVRLFLEALQTDRLDLARHARLDLRRRNRIGVLDVRQRFERRRGAERRPAGQELVEDRAERVDVGRGPILRRFPSACSGAM